MIRSRLVPGSQYRLLLIVVASRLVNIIYRGTEVKERDKHASVDCSAGLFITRAKKIKQLSSEFPGMLDAGSV